MRGPVAALVALSAALALAGCAGQPPGVDGDLTNGWPAMPRATITVPVVGACYLTHYVSTGSGDVGVVPCATQTHYVETAYVAAFTGADAQRSEPPAPNSPAMAGAYAQCQKGAADYLGGDWHSGYLALGVVIPETAAWRGGARWFRCDLIHYADLFGDAVVDHGVLKGDLAGLRAVAIGCLSTIVDTTTHGVIGASPIDCGQPHAAEFAGTFTAPDLPYPADNATQEKMLRTGCGPVIATFLGLPATDQWQNQSVGEWTTGWTQEQWALGDRTTRCFAYAFTKSGTFVGSVKGIKNQTAKG